MSANIPPTERLPNRLPALIWFFVRRRGWGMVALAGLPLLNAGVTASYSNATRHITNAVLAANETGGDAAQSAIKPLLYFAILVSTTLLIRVLQWTASYRTRMPLAADIRRTIFGYVQRHDALYFENNLSGKIAHKTALLPDQVRSIVERCCFDLFPAVGFFIVTMFYASTARPLFAGVIAGWLTLYFGITYIIGRGTAVTSSRHNEAKTHLTGRVVDVIVNIKNVIFNAAHAHEDMVIGGTIDHVRKLHGESFLAIVRLRFSQQVLNILMWLTLYSLAIYEWVNHAINAGDFVLITTLGGLMITRAQDVGDMLPDFIDDIGSASETVEALIVPRELIDAPNAIALDVPRGEIRFDDINFAYNRAQPVFDHLFLQIEAGQRVGLIGASGAGKTTLTALLLRLQDIDSGRILIDGQDIRQVTQASLRRQIGLIPQDTILFHRNLMDNIRYGRPEASDAEVIEAARQAHADEFIRALPKGYQTLVGERGVKLSGGQRQRVAIARALLKQAPILVLDEATSALDSESEAMIQQAMMRAMQGRTVIAIAHRLSTIAHLDRLIVLDKGRVVEDGSHAQLLAKDGLYAKLWKRQSGGFLIDGARDDAQPASEDLPDESLEDEPLIFPTAAMRDERKNPPPQEPNN